ncbi:TPA: hypothetical protein ACH3X1_015279 [Trebouxia sp. C0004]
MCYAAFSMQKRCCRRFVASKARSRLVSTASLTVSLAAAADANVRSRSTSCMLWYKYSQFSKPWPQGVENERILRSTVQRPSLIFPFDLQSEQPQSRFDTVSQVQGA